jgi:hypothetical protein
MVNKFSDAFFEELIVVPPDRDIEFVFEIVPKLLLCITDPIGWPLSN